MMKKNGFTLAEVLITLAIIGVVATLTLPSLMSNTAEQQAITGFKKAMNTLNEVAQLNAAVDGFDYSSITKTTAPGNTTSPYTNGVLDQSIWGMMVTKAQVNIAASGTSKIPAGGCATTYTNHIIFRDGTALCYERQTTNTSDGVIKGYVDTNGAKAPNMKSECGDANCGTNKIIKDQFAITLRGATAIPGHATVSLGVVTEGADAASNAARWAMSK